MIEENVVSQAGTTFCMGVADMRRLIIDLGYEARQRDNWYPARGVIENERVVQTGCGQCAARGAVHRFPFSKTGVK